ncbi:hypothetical protein ETAA8_17120 [Anatilimnocola aggregata]|uniref:Uncharacterized protein n=1 Tax=Anatilimnocola aggregata TaxID=2528021 RepID=A0A517Y8V3_9BACT|nr:hypothetical protein [Anatilimnocola aggregata]QDU26631.1 hypothetical protein ETAA8_17120 [Anatilimnocola aggregata]
MKLASIALSLVVAVIALVAVESASAQGFGGYSYSWSSGGNCQPGFQQNCSPYGQPNCQPGMGLYNRPVCPPQYGMNPGYCPPSFRPSGQQMTPHCGTGMTPRQHSMGYGYNP